MAPSPQRAPQVSGGRPLICGNSSSPCPALKVTARSHDQLNYLLPVSPSQSPWILWTKLESSLRQNLGWERNCG